MAMEGINKNTFKQIFHDYWDMSSVNYNSLNDNYFFLSVITSFS